MNSIVFHKNRCNREINMKRLFILREIIIFLENSYNENVYEPYAQYPQQILTETWIPPQTW